MISLLLAALAAAPVTGEGAHPKLLVLDLETSGDVDKAASNALGGAITARLSSEGTFDVTSQKDVQTLLGVERQRQLMGCGEEGSCLTELAGAIGARFVLSGSIARLGATYQLTLQTLDSKTTRPIGRAVRLAKTVEALEAGLPWALAEATATPPPPVPTHLGPYALMFGGGIVVASGGVLGILALNQEASVKKELDLGVTTPSVLKPVSYYQSQASQVSTQKTVALCGLVGGAALVGLGFWLNPRDDGGRVAVRLGGDGIALAGTW